MRQKVLSSHRSLALFWELLNILNRKNMITAAVQKFCSACGVKIELRVGSKPAADPLRARQSPGETYRHFQHWKQSTGSHRQYM